jgi:glycosyltransferase involved in cell wall biosynthesis
MSAKRIVIQDYAGHPFQVRLSRELARQGHRVLHVYAGFNQTPHGSLHKLVSDPEQLNIKAIYIHHPLQKYSFVRRWFQEREYGYLVTKEILSFKPDVVISANMPLNAQAILLKACRKRDIRFVYWLQDVVSMGTKLILSKKFPLIGNLIGNYYSNLEKQLLMKSDHVVSIADEYESFLLDWGISKQKMSVIYNWAPLDELPVLPKDNSWSREHGLATRFCFLYSGTLGLKHNPDLILQIALHFKDRPQVIIFVGSEGPGAEWLNERRNEFNLSNLVIMGYVPMDIFPQVLAAGDVLLAILEVDAGVFSVPSKVLSYLAAQKPLLLAVPPNNLAAQIVKSSQAGYVVHPADVNGMITKAEELFSNKLLREEFAHNARRYAEENFDICRIGSQFLNLINKTT